jgi:signal transduction histidine kinase
MAAARARWAPGSVLGWALVATVVLGVGTSVVSVVEVQRARREVDVLARTADRSSFLVGEIGRDITRLRVKALDRLLVPDAEENDVEERFATIASGLDGRLGDLEQLLAPHERTAWARFRPLVTDFRGRLDIAMAAVRAGEVDQARAILLDEVRPLAVTMQDHLETLARLNQDASSELLSAADARLARVRAIETLLGVGLVAGLGVIWWTALHMLARHRRQLAEYVARIERSNGDLDAFAARIAHDLRNALSPVGLIAGTLREMRDGSDLVQRMAGQLLTSVRRCKGLIDGLLAFSRPAQLPDDGAVASVSAVVRDVLEEVAPLAARVGAAVDVDAIDVAVHCPPGLLHLVGANVIGNALKYLEGRPRRAVRVSVRRCADGWCELAVEDSGPGIPEESRAHVFEPFYRVPGTVVVGTGIGLATVRRIVERYGGAVALESEVGRGSTFTVRLPAVEVEPAEQTAAASAS